MILALIISYFIVKSYFNVFIHNILSAIFVVIFVVLFALSLACMIRAIRLKIKETKRLEKGSILAFIAYILGFVAIQTCFVSGVCGVNLAISILMIFLPFTFVNFFMKYGLFILIFSDILLFVSLLTMKCFKKF